MDMRMGLNTLTVIREDRKNLEAQYLQACISCRKGGESGLGVIILTDQHIRSRTARKREECDLLIEHVTSRLVTTGHVVVLQIMEARRRG
jgi:hypothetical protein